MRVAAVLFAFLSVASALQLPMQLRQQAAKVAPAVAAAVTVAQTNVGMAVAGGQSEGTGLIFGIDDGRETLVLAVVFFGFFTLYNGWAAGQPDSNSDFFGEYDERRAK
mmetsp:Transcript_22723/g.69853  ORF Transcript_22723/g.69853 Transcript_22723/m.69853 type:complete len:108 (+) Transcript_22723:70-393(+)